MEKNELAGRIKVFAKAKSSIMRYSKSILRQEEQLIQQSEQSKGIAEDLNTLTSAPKGRLAGLPEDFDPGMYLALNRDVATAGLDPSQHYLTTGAHEGRLYATTYAQDGLFTVHNSNFQTDPDFACAYARGLKATEPMEYNWHWRVHVGLWAARVAARLPGDFVECGVNRGFLSSAIMEDLNWNSLDRTFWLLDTFSGIDTAIVSLEEIDPGSKERNQKFFESGLYTADVDAVRKNFAEWSNVEIVVGSVPGTLEKITAERIAFASIDMNTAPPEVAAMEFLWPRLVPGAMIVLDDYAYHGYLPQYLAMNEFAKRHNISILLLPTGQGLIVRPPE